jgi:hypothetical protein
MGPGISVSDALASDLDEPLLVNGFVVVEGERARLCEMLLESFPAQCGGDALEVDGLDLGALSGVRTEGTVSWTEGSVQVLGTVEGGKLTVSTTSIGSGVSQGEAQYEVSVEIRADTAAPADFGTEPGEPIADAEVELSNSLVKGNLPITGVTDSIGRVILMAPAGSYNIFVSAPTSEPLCVWLGSGSVIVADSPASVTLDDLWVACQ